MLTEDTEMATEDSMHESTDEKTDLLRQSKRRNKDGSGGKESELGSANMPKSQAEEEGRTSYMDSVLRRGKSGYTQAFVTEDEGAISDDDPLEEGKDGTWFAMGMTKEEKIEATNILIIKLVERSVVYHYL